RLTLTNAGARAAVFHVYDRRDLEAGPRRYTIEGGRTLSDAWAAGDGLDLQVMGPDGFHRRFERAGSDAGPEA
ncbi:phospholipase domain-containing protein, partial [Pseudomonas pergaminensis]